MGPRSGLRNAGSEATGETREDREPSCRPDDPPRRRRGNQVQTGEQALCPLPFACRGPNVTSMGGEPGGDSRPQAARLRDARPLLLVVDADPERLERCETELERGFGVDFRVRGELTAAAAIECLQQAHDWGRRVAVVLVDHAFADDARTEILTAARTLHPDARRALLIEWGAWANRATASAILSAMSVGDINYYVLKPWIAPRRVVPSDGRGVRPGVVPLTRWRTCARWS